jgi:hypothetical protein
MNTDLSMLQVATSTISFMMEICNALGTGDKFLNPRERCNNFWTSHLDPKDMACYTAASNRTEPHNPTAHNSFNSTNRDTAPGDTAPRSLFDM